MASRRRSVGRHSDRRTAELEETDVAQRIFEREGSPVVGAGLRAGDGARMAPAAPPPSVA